MLDALQLPFDPTTSTLAQMAFRVLMPFFHQDVAVVVGGLLIVEQNMPPALVIASLFAGVLASDLFLFGLGGLARRSARVGSLLDKPTVEHISHWLLANTFLARIVARVEPGVIFPVYVGCGLFGVRKALFITVTMLTGLI